ncbi:MAG: vanomycin resistance protein VanB [Armatimonadetes bacterium]|nr:vanomycin resistance protein VanB [Armatimonadota bacterium]
MKPFRLVILLCVVAGVGAALWLPRREQVLGSYATGLRGRTKGQRENALRAARPFDGFVLDSGKEFSFNKTVGPWTSDRGYVRAPVSYSGELVLDWGGGVCQTSSALYNAALIAGLEIVERHPHTWTPPYVPPGRDAAVAQYTIDLRFRNPHPWPVRIRALTTGETLGFQIIGRQRGPMAAVTVEPQSPVEPIEVTRTSERLPPGQRVTVTRGRPGVRVTVYRTPLHGPQAGQRQLVSRDVYPALHRLVKTGPER